MTRLTAALLRQQDDICSAAVLNLVRHMDIFKQLAISEGEMIIRRDREDGEKLSVGINIAKAKGLLHDEPNIVKPTRINVTGITVQQITDEIMRHIYKKEGNIIVIQGLSGTGKGTVVERLKKQLPKCVTWSNGNVFRSFTYLCREFLQNEAICAQRLTPELLQRVEKQVTFEQIENGQYDIILKGNIRVMDIQNTILKIPEISAAVPTVAQQTQGEVIHFATSAVKKLTLAGYNVILEGRAQTLNYISTPLRFELVMNNITLLGERRAAQRIMAKALFNIKDELNDATDKIVEEAILKALNEI